MFEAQSLRPNIPGNANNQKRNGCSHTNPYNITPLYTLLYCSSFHYPKITPIYTVPRQPTTFFAIYLGLISASLGPRAQNSGAQRGLGLSVYSRTSGLGLHLGFGVLGPRAYGWGFRTQGLWLGVWG